MRQNENELKQKSELPAHEVSFVRLRKRVNILASNSPVAIFAPLLGKVEKYLKVSIIDRMFSTLIFKTLKQ
jgi:hypothetical protein